MTSNLHFDDDGRVMLFMVKPTTPHGWTVYIDGRSEAHYFTSKSLALTYGRMWARANPPSLLVLLDKDGEITSHWKFAQSPLPRPVERQSPVTLRQHRSAA
ncbi:MAG: DUF2188 domain-containing protein [Burkholderiales bacterium]|nr:DUF2188 domain-containing protein [Burkholderiales bacterium]